MNCTRCGHDREEHEGSSGPCNHKDYYTTGTHCICYAFVYPTAPAHSHTAGHTSYWHTCLQCVKELEANKGAK